MRFERQPPLVHITASKGSSPGPCALRVRRVNLTHKVISVKIFTLSLCSVFLLITLENVKGEFESFAELPSERETGIENRDSPLNCVSRK